MYVDRVSLYEKLEEKLNSKLLVYVTSDRPGFETSIGQDVIDIFINQLDNIGITEKISLYLYTFHYIYTHVAEILRLHGILSICCDSIAIICKSLFHIRLTVQEP